MASALEAKAITTSDHFQEDSCVLVYGNGQRIPRRTTLIWSKNMPVLCQEYMLFFCLPLSIQPRLSTQQQGHAWWGGRHTGGARPCCCVLSLGWLLNGKQKNSIYSWQRTGIFFQKYFVQKPAKPATDLSHNGHQKIHLVQKPFWLLFPASISLKAF